MAIDKDDQRALDAQMEDFQLTSSRRREDEFMRDVIRTTPLETDSDKRKAIPVHTGFNQYFPDAIAEVAQLSYDSNEKHNPGEPLHWSRDKSDDHADCLMRHQLEAGTRDTDGHLHSTKVAWRAMAQLQLEIENGRRD